MLGDPRLSESHEPDSQTPLFNSNFLDKEYVEEKMMETTKNKLEALLADLENSKRDDTLENLEIIGILFEAPLN
jgi:hypothetical protein